MNFLGLNLSYLSVDVSQIPTVPDYKVNYDYYTFEDVAEDKVITEINSTINSIEIGYEFENDDAAWVLSCTFMIFTMQTGFGLIESGMCHRKNEVNILMTNVMDVALGGFTFWFLGYGLAFGNSPYTNSFIGIDGFLFNRDVNNLYSGESLLHFFYQMALSSTATTICSGAMAERANFRATMIFVTVNVLIYALPAHWIWHESGWLYQLGARDLAGSGPVHLLGGVSGLVAAYMLGPRLGRSKHSQIAMGNAKNSLIGLFMLWWGTLAFNSGSTFGVTIDKWAYAARSTVATMCCSFGGGITGLLICYIFFAGKIDVAYILNCVFGSLAAITGSCYMVRMYEAVCIGLISGLITFLTMLVIERTKLDDPCGSFAVHGMNGAWGLIALGLFGHKEHEKLEYDGLLYNGGVYQLYVQFLAVFSITAWTIITTYLILWMINKITPLRTQVVCELLGADYTVHNIMHGGASGIAKAVETLKYVDPDIPTDIEPTGNNLGHSMYLEDNYAEGFDLRSKKLENAGLTLSMMFAENVRLLDVQEFIEHTGVPKNIRPTSGGGAFGRYYS